MGARLCSAGYCHRGSLDCNLLFTRAHAFRRSSRKNCSCLPPSDDRPPGETLQPAEKFEQEKS